jgi:hypothetical protein
MNMDIMAVYASLCSHLDFVLRSHVSNHSCVHAASHPLTRLYIAKPSSHHLCIRPSTYHKNTRSDPDTYNAVLITSLQRRQQSYATNTQKDNIKIRNKIKRERSLTSHRTLTILQESARGSYSSVSTRRGGGGDRMGEYPGLWVRGITQSCSSE